MSAQVSNLKYFTNQKNYSPYKPVTPTNSSNNMNQSPLKMTNPQ